MTQMRLIANMVDDVIGFKEPCFQILDKRHDKLDISLNQKWDFPDNVDLHA